MTSSEKLHLTTDGASALAPPPQLLHSTLTSEHVNQCTSTWLQIIHYRDCNSSFLILLLLNVHITQAAAPERVWPDRLNEGTLQKRDENDVEYNLYEKEEEEAVEDPLPLLLVFFLILLLNVHSAQVAARERSWPDRLEEGILQRGDEDDVQYDLEEEVEEEEEAVEEPGRATNPLAAAGWFRRVRERIRRILRRRRCEEARCRRPARRYPIFTVPL
nr:unnamed protein product [Spirometra erinaceieuropaei]